jgi:ATP-dependent Clp protease ATP-binding subunit ClpA
MVPEEQPSSFGWWMAQYVEPFIEQTLVRREIGDKVFERFTDRARRVVVLAQEEARMLNHNYIGTEHVLLGLIHEGEGVAFKSLESLGISLEGVRSQVEEIIGHGQQAPTGHIPFTPRGKKVLELSLREALQLGHNYIGTEHILLGLIREGEGVGAQVLVALGADLTTARTAVIQLLSGYQGNATVDRAVRDKSPVEQLDDQIADIRRQKEALIGALDFEGAAAAREREKQFIVSRNEIIKAQRPVVTLRKPNNTETTINHAVAVTRILQAHDVQATTTLVTQLIDWKTGAGA